MIIETKEQLGEMTGISSPFLLKFLWNGLLIGTIKDEQVTATFTNKENHKTDISKVNAIMQYKVDKLEIIKDLKAVRTEIQKLEAKTDWQLYYVRKAVEGLITKYQEKGVHNETISK